MINEQTDMSAEEGLIDRCEQKAGAETKDHQGNQEYLCESYVTCRLLSQFSVPSMIDSEIFDNFGAKGPQKLDKSC